MFPAEDVGAKEAGTLRIVEIPIGSTWSHHVDADNLIRLANKLERIGVAAIGQHACDELTHNIATRLNKSFITPFDREDIYTMSTALDDIVDLIDDAARAIIIFDVQEITDYARDFADVIERMAEQLTAIVATLQRPKNITQRLVEIHRLENEGDDIYHAAIAELFHDSHDALTVLKWKEVYEKLEAAVDRCENVANIIEGVIIKHT